MHRSDRFLRTYDAGFETPETAQSKPAKTDAAPDDKYATDLRPIGSINRIKSMILKELLGVAFEEYESISDLQLAPYSEIHELVIPRPETSHTNAPAKSAEHRHTYDPRLKTWHISGYNFSVENQCVGCGMTAYFPLTNRDIGRCDERVNRSRIKPLIDEFTDFLLSSAP